ncbi:MAG: hypothetical protein HZA02_03755 [Nitrospinae bacterium]|nr:hypothetical protein [Nitrospinota bacterium]
MGRDASAYDSTSAWNYNGNPYAAEMIAKGFNPIKDPRGSLEVLASSPLDIGRLLFGKLFTEIPGFLFDPGGTFLTPLHLSFESFHAAHVQFYIYFFIAAGLLLFLTNKQISPPIKGLVLAPVVLQALFASLAILGTFRFRAQITPLNMIFLGLAFEKLLFGRDDRRSRELEETERDESRLEFNRPCPAGWKGAAVIPVAAFLFLAGLLTLRGSQIDARDVGGSMPWLSIHEGNLIAIGNIGLDATLFAFYDSGKSPPPARARYPFICAVS